MSFNSYPALYVAADNASVRAQSTFLRLIVSHSILLIVGASLTINPLPTNKYSLINALVFLAALGISILIALKKYEKVWYSARAVAESVKTATWRYMMKAEPFDNDDLRQANSNFRNLLIEILNSNNQLGEVIGGEISASDQITTEMEQTRDKSIGDRKKIYLQMRIDEQRKWYANKSGYNKCMGSCFFWLLIILQSAAIVCVLARIVYPDFEYWPTDIFVVAASSVVVWTQVKRFRELSIAYSLAAHEIGIIRGKLLECDNENEFSEFVADAENAFSREHTQWIARRDT